MIATHRRALLCGLVLLLAAVAQAAEALGEDERALHALNRLAFGPRPGDVDRVQQVGVERWIEAQLAPAAIDDAQLERRLAAYHTLTLDSVELVRELPPPQLLRQIVKQLTTRAGMDTEEILSFLPEAEPIVASERARNRGDLADEVDAQKTRARSMTPQDRFDRTLASAQRVAYELSEAKMLRATLSERQLHEVMVDFWFNHFNVYAAKGNNRLWLASYERDAIRKHALGNFRDLLGATARHPAMLTYLDNWLSVAEGSRSYGLATRLPAADAIREMGLPHGGAATLLLRDRGVDTRSFEAEAKRREERLRRGRNGRRAQRLSAVERASQPQSSGRGLNENYARELLELHTLGVDGGYTQQDIIEVARCFTGWTVLPIHAGQGFVYIDELHDSGKKRVLGKPIRARGQAEGEEVLDRLARHPATARFISTKLARKFVADDPPAELVDRLAATFLESDGDIRTVLRTLFASPEFWSADSFRAKVKTPFELVVSMVRATDATINHNERLIAAAADVGGPSSDSKTMKAARVQDFPGRDRPPQLARLVRQLGQPLYLAQPPTGYKDHARAWVSTGALLNRMKAAMALAANRTPGVAVPLPAADAQSIEALAVHLLGSEIEAPMVDAIAGQLELDDEELAELGLPPRFSRSRDGQARLAMGWLMATPEFQRR